MKSQPDLDQLAKRFGGTAAAAAPTPPVGKTPDLDRLAQQFGGTSQVSAPSAFPATPAPSAPPEGPKTVGGFLENIPSSLWNLVSSVPGAVAGLGQAAVGAAQMTSPTFRHMAGEAVPDYQDMLRKFPENTKQMLVERYGGWDRVLDTAYKDPAGFATDLSAILSVGTAPARVAGRAAGVIGATSAAAKLGEVGEISKTIDPFHMIARTGGAVIDATNPGVAKVLGLGIGRKGEEINIAINKTSPEFQRALQGQVSESKLMNQVRSAVEQLKDERGAKYQQTLSQIPMSQPVQVAPVTNELIKDIQNSRISVVPPAVGQPPTLDFTGSRIGKSGQSLVDNAFQDYVNTMSRGDISVEGMDALKRRLDSELFTHEGSSKATTPEGRVVMRLRDNIHDAITSGVPEYAQLTGDYHTATDFIRRFEKEFSVRPGDNPGTAFRKMQNILNQNSEYRKTLIDALDSKANTALKDQFAGYALHHWIPQGLMRSGAAMDLLFSLSRGHVPLELLVTSPRLMGSFAMRYGQASRLGGKMLYQITSPRIRTGQILGRGAPPPEEPEPMEPEPFPETGR